MEQDHFSIDASLDEAEKLALLAFMAQEFGLDQSLSYSGAVQDFAARFLFQEYSRKKIKADLIYWDLNGLSHFDPSLLEEPLELLSKKGIICVDGGRLETLKSIVPAKFEPILEVPGFGIYSRQGGARSVSSMRYQVDLFRRKYFFEKWRKVHGELSGRAPIVAVIVLTYKHEDYIAECINSVLAQRGNFSLRVIVIDDASPDNTAKVVRNTIAGIRKDSLEVEVYVNSHNLGVVKNLATAIRLAEGCDYLTFCEGDDFWCSDARVQEHLNFLANRPECVMSFNTIELCAADGSERRIYGEQAAHPQDVIDGPLLASCNLIGNFTACFYDGALIKVIPDKLFDMYTVDWMFNLYCSQFGGIAHLRKTLSVYRQHDGGEWSNRKAIDKAFTLRKLSNEYNSFLDYQFDKGWQKYKNELLEWIFYNHCQEIERFDIIIVDDVFPASFSGFRYAEFTSYLKEFPNSTVLASGATLPLLGDDSLDEVVRKFQRRNPELGNQIITDATTFPFCMGKVLYVNFLNNAYELVTVAEKARVPFAFTLYPGGGFVLNNSDCDRKLKRIFESPCFCKVIVTQQVTFEYLVRNGLCPIEKIEMIFGVVMPQETFGDPIPPDKARWGFDKNRLDICFMAHRYTPHGEDKGYDVFINAACKLRKSYDDIFFHIVGPYNNRIIDVTPIRDRILFHGTLNPDQLDGFFKDMDIIMSPNISGKIFPGSFDGFPTASCTEGGLRGTTIFCTDEFNSGKGRFTDGQDFVLIQYDIDHIVSQIAYYYRNPEKLKAVGESGSLLIRNLYSYNAQMKPRINLLREVMESPFVFDVEKMRNVKHTFHCAAAGFLNIASTPEPSPMWRILKKHSPETLKKLYRKYIKKIFRPRHV